jgi:hypothetical protein
MSSDIKVGQDRMSFAAATPITKEALRREKSGRIRKMKPMKLVRRQNLIQLLYSFEAARHFRVDDRVDGKFVALRRFDERVRRPVQPNRISGEEIQQDIAVDQNHLLPGVAHDFISRDFNGSTAARTLDPVVESTWLAPTFL